MAYVIAEPCIDVLDISCVSVCPVDCIHYDEGTDRKLFIDRLSFVKSNKIKNRIQKHGYPTPEEAAEERAQARERRKAAKEAVPANREK